MKKFSYAGIIFFIILLNVSLSYANIPEIVLNQKRAVVTIYVNDKDGKQIGTGTGFIIDSNGIIATNYHVMSMCLKNDNTSFVKMENGAFFGSYVYRHPEAEPCAAVCVCLAGSSLFSAGHRGFYGQCGS